MLGKLIKHEFLDTYKLLCIYYAIVIALTIISSITISSSAQLPTSYTQSFLYAIISIVISCAYTVMLSMLGLITILALCSHFNKSMYGDRGYLTHTLPVSKGSILTAKYFVSIVWFIASTLVTILSVLIFLSFLNHNNMLAISLNGFIGISWQEWDTNLKDTFGIGLAPFIGLCALLLLVTVLHIFSFLWACISIGQLANEKKNMLGVISGICLVFAEFFIKRWIRQSLHISMYGDIFETIVSPRGNHPTGNLSVMTSGILIGLSFFAVETFVTWFISSKKLNLA